MAAESKAAAVPDGKVEPAPTPVTAQEHGVQRRTAGPKRARRKREPAHQAESEPSAPTLRGRPSERARALVREQLKYGPRLGASVLAAAHAADIPERALIAAASVLGVRTKRGEWWLPTSH